MKKDAEKGQIFTRRAIVIGGLQATIMAVISGRLAWLQLAEGQRYRTLSDKNRINVKMLIPARGQIVDRFGVPLAVNNQNFCVTVVPEQTGNLEQSLRALQKHIDIGEERIESVLKQAKKTAKFVPLEVKEGLNWEEVATVEVNMPDLPGISIDVGEMRNYPFAESASHIVGYVGAVSKGDLSETEDPVLTQPGFKIGKTAIEKKYDYEMRGRAGTSEVEVNVVGREIRELKRADSRAGQRVVLTIDGELQRVVHKRLAEEQSASAVIMDVHSGAVYALASYPSFDPNEFSRGISAAMWEELLANPGYPLTNKAVAGQYPPASTFKMITALAGLRAGVITPQRSVFCPGYYEFGDGRFHCWRPEGHGAVNVVQALEKSCDTFFYQLSTEIGIDRIAEMARELGLGSKLGFDLTEERPGLIPDQGWKKSTYGESWQPGETIVASIGQGYLLATPLQLAVMISRLVNGGFAVKPWIAGYVGDHLKYQGMWPKLNLNDSHLALVRQGMEDVVNSTEGTAVGSRIKEEAMAMAGKTGTAQVQRITMQQRSAGIKNENLPWLQRHHALFVGYAPYQAPRYACAVVVEHGIGGARTAAPIARDILLEAQKRNPAATPLHSENVADNKEQKQKPI